ncbi:MAG: hypothetical protein O3A01_08060 [bacterium]|nr:hypothetical protein [bacterium]
MRHFSNSLLIIPMAFLVLGCSVSGGGGSSSESAADEQGASDNNVAEYSIGGTLTGLGASKNVVLQNNEGNDLSLSATGNFEFSIAMPSGGNYVVSVLTQPSSETCSVSNGSGTISADNVTNVSVVCSTDTYEEAR